VEAPGTRGTASKRDRHRDRHEPTVADYLAASLDRQHDLEQLVTRLFARIEEQNILLNSALHELAAEKAHGISHQLFINRWYADRRMRLG
jgi:hypothetical protein